MNKKISLGIAITVIILAVALTLSATMVLSMRYFSSLVSNVGQREAMYDYIDEIDASARQYYTIDEEKLRTALAEGYVGGLGDVYAEYLSAEEFQAVQSTLAGNRTGFGIQVTLSRDNQLVISSVDVNSPAALSGIEKGDILLAIDGEELTGALYSTVQSKLNSSEKIVLSVSHSGLQSAVELATNTYTNVSVESRIISDNVGYIGISDFNNLTPLQFKNAYNELTQNGAAYFIFDVRNNRGGSLDAVKEILDYLLPRGPYAVCEEKNVKETFTAEDSYEITGASATLINGRTAGEAELFAAALQDRSKTKLVGTSTEGKAVVQNYYSIDSDKAAVRLTVGKLSLMQSGKTWADTGLYPDAMVDLSYETLLYFDLLADSEDAQLQKAISLVRENTQLSMGDEENLKAPTTTTAATSASATTTTK